jgi:hypothetical protein
MILSVKLGGRDDEFTRILDGIHSSQDFIYLMIERTKVPGNVCVIWQNLASMIDEGSRDRKVALPKLNVFTSTGKFYPYLKCN